MAGQNTEQDGSLLKQGSQKWKQNLYKFLVSKGVKMQKTHFKAKGFANKHWGLRASLASTGALLHRRTRPSSRCPCRRYLERCKGKLLVARCAAA